LKKKSILVAGIGNSFRCDDRAGLLVIDFISDAINYTPFEALIDVKKLSGEGAELIQEWEGYDQVYLVDASQSFGSPGKLTRIDTQTSPLKQDYFHYSSHNFSLAEAVELSRQLGDLPKKLIVYAIEGINFSSGINITYEVEISCMDAARKILDEIIFISEKINSL